MGQFDKTLARFYVYEVDYSETNLYNLKRTMCCGFRNELKI